ncbi:hypothetical protein IZ6_20950 [Terrihabitans soli]|uniref:EAL domain-containing protein n=1 Tax=Terrihabitans soli TaxID=708113 RepID=A0A6S6QWF6_9HYPH|nr:EAL domain-containing protein [Terrihabitans soli]BCJ91360.1 hypothetical protein IZ6_20950 [Terrihabitans soli]
MQSTIEDLLNRFFGKRPKPSRRPRVLSPADAPPPGGQPVLGSTECVVVQPLGPERSNVLQALSRSGMKVREVASIDAEDFGKRKPHLVISSFDDPAKASDTVTRLASISYDGLVQPIGAGHGIVHLPSIKGGPRVLPPMPALLMPEDLIEVIETQGLSRNSAGQATVHLATALSKKWMSFAYQPKIALRTMQLAGAETLARVQHPIHGELLPGSFLPHSTAQDLRLLGLGSMRAALASWEPFYRLGFNLVLSVNIPLEALEIEEFSDLIRAHRPEDSRWPGLIVEVDAVDTIAAIDELKEFGAKMRQHGVVISLDNFGLGNTMTADLSEIGAAEIKLHPEIGQDVSKNPARAAICRAALDLAKIYKANLCCNSIETLADATFLRNLGCHSAQGHVFADAMDRVRFAQLLKSKVGRAAS